MGTEGVKAVADMMKVNNMAASFGSVHAGSSSNILQNHVWKNVITSLKRSLIKFFLPGMYPNGYEGPGPKSPEYVTFVVCSSRKSETTLQQEILQ
jgi:hypothetical protein